MSHASFLSLLMVIVVLLGAPDLCASLPQDTPPKISSSLALLSALQRDYPDRIPEEARAFVTGDKVRAVIRFKKVAVDHDTDRIKGLGVDLDTSEIHGSGHRHKGACIPWQALDAVSRLDSVELIDSAWQPGVWPTLDLSATAVRATDLWAGPSQVLRTMGGQSAVIADFDTGVDVFHPGLWRADGPAFDWIDVNGNTAFDSGVDAVDLNDNGIQDIGESLAFFKAQVKNYAGALSNTTGPFVPQLDWLYNDANGNSIRDYGILFGESTPTFGERLFILDDLNGNGLIDLGEKLLALGTSKVAAVLGSGGQTFTRGVDLIASPPDSVSEGHGTAVSGILCGEEPWLRKYVGISPQIDLLVADHARNDFTTYIPWAESRGAKVMLYEFGAWVYQFLDGTSPLEQAISAEWENGVAQVIPAGNLANGKKHAFSKTNKGSAEFSFVVPVRRGITTIYLTVLWIEAADDLSFTLTNPSGVKMTLPGDMRFYSDPSGNLCWSYGIQTSPRGTRRFDVYISKSSGITTGTWKLGAISPSKAAGLHAYLSDNIGGWNGGAYFSGQVNTSYTVCWPATADKALVVGSYSTRGITVPVGAISVFSGKGPRIDGAPAVDICAPGNYDVFTICSKDAGNPLGSYKEFTGTTAAAPHVASACALLLQLNPTLQPDLLAYLLTSSASTDSFTGTTPNPVWGYGKLDIFTASAGVAIGEQMNAADVRAITDGNSATLFAKQVVAVSSDNTYFFVEETDRSSGIRVLGSGVSERDVVLVSGKMTTIGLERAIQASDVKVLQHDQAPIYPVGMLNSCVGDPSLGSRGLGNLGILITTWGRVAEFVAGGFIVDDGSGRSVKVASNATGGLQIGSFVAVTGMSTAPTQAGESRPVILPRMASDIRVFQ